MSTEHRDLRTGESVWQAGEVPCVTPDILMHDIAVDVLVVGAGISGALIADTLTEKGHAVAIIDRRGPCKGSTVASTALLLHEIDMPLTELAHKIGDARAERAWRRSRRAVLDLERRVRNRGIAADTVARQSLYLAGDLLNRDALRREVEARRVLGLPAEFLDAASLAERFGIRRDAGILSGDSFEADPIRMTAGFLGAVAGRGARIYAPVELTGVTAERDRVTASTRDGPAISCRHLVFATGYERPDQVPGSGTEVTSTWVIATVPQPDRLWPGRGLIWEASDPYLYLRTTRDGRIVCGGEDEEFEDEDRRDAKIADKTRRLAEKLLALFPDVDPRVEFAWAGSFGQTGDGLPRIGAVPGLPNCYAAMGYGGNGFTFSQIAADIIGGAICGTPDPDADLFALG